MQTRKLFNVIFFLLFMLTGGKVFAQNPRSVYFEPEFEVEFSGAEKWSHSFGVANRSIFFTYLDGEKIASAQQEHLELNHFTAYKVGANSSLALGLRYRFREIFEENRHNEFRIIEQFSYKQPDTYLNFAHRVRFEQRFRDQTIYRGRYQLGIARPLSEEFGVGLATEFLWSMTEGVRPEAEQRFSIEFENSSFENLELNAGLEYRFENFNYETEENIFILTGVTLNLD